MYRAYSVCTKNRRCPSLAVYVQKEAILRRALTMSWCFKPCELPMDSAKRSCARMSLELARLDRIDWTAPKYAITCAFEAVQPSDNETMNKGKTKLTRQDAERLFEGLPASKVSASSRPENPFGPPSSSVVKRADDESTLWKDNLITLPVGIELPAGYESASRLREAMTRAWRVKWVREGRDELVAEFPEGWTAVRRENGPIELRDQSGVVRALCGWAKDAELRLLPRYSVESQANSSTGLSSLLVRDRANSQILERSSVWSARTGTNHPDWTKLAAWLDLRYPDHRDPLRYWEDCEENRRS